MPLNKQTLWGREPGGSEVGSLDVWMFEARGGSICRILRGLEAPGGSRFREPIGTGWVPLNKQTLGGREPGGSEVGSLDVLVFGARKLEVWMFGEVWMLGCWDVWMFGGHF